MFAQGTPGWREGNTGLVGNRASSRERQREGDAPAEDAGVDPRDRVKHQERCLAGIKPSFSDRLLCTGARQVPAACGDTQGT